MGTSPLTDRPSKGQRTSSLVRVYPMRPSKTWSEDRPPSSCSRRLYSVVSRTLSTPPATRVVSFMVPSKEHAHERVADAGTPPPERSNYQAKSMQNPFEYRIC